MRAFVVVASLVLLPSAAALATTPSNASLKGTYFIQLSQVQEVYWSNTVSAKCFGTTYTQVLGGQTSSTKLDIGTITFSGSGTFSMSVTQYGDFDQTLSNNTVTMSCTSNSKAPVTTNSGSAVFDAAAPMSITGTYTVTSSETGTMTFAGGKSDEIVDLSIGQLNSSGVAGVVLINQVLKPNNQLATGIAILK